MSKHVGEKCGKWADGDRTDGELDGRTDGDPEGDPDGHHHTIIRPVWRRAYKKDIFTILQGFLMIFIALQVKRYTMCSGPIDKNPIEFKTDDAFIGGLSPSMAYHEAPPCVLDSRSRQSTMGLSASLICSASRRLRYDGLFYLTINTEFRAIIFNIIFYSGRFYAPGLKGPPGHLIIGSSVCQSVRLSVRNSVPLSNKVPYLQ